LVHDTRKRGILSFSELPYANSSEMLEGLQTM